MKLLFFDEFCKCTSSFGTGSGKKFRIFKDPDPQQRKFVNLSGASDTIFLLYHKKSFFLETPFLVNSKVEPC
jgi:hypothetical protein